MSLRYVTRFVVAGVALVAGACQGVWPKPPPPEAMQAQVALADVAKRVAARARMQPNYAGFFITPGSKPIATFLFTQSPIGTLSRLTRDARFRAKLAQFNLLELERAKIKAIGDFSAAGVPFRVVTIDVSRNRVLVDGIDVRAWQRAIKSGYISEDSRVLYFFRSGDY